MPRFDDLQQRAELTEKARKLKLTETSIEQLMSYDVGSEELVETIAGLGVLRGLIDDDAKLNAIAQTSETYPTLRAIAGTADKDERTELMTAILQIVA